MQNGRRRQLTVDWPRLLSSSRRGLVLYGRALWAPTTERATTRVAQGADGGADRAATRAAPTALGGAIGAYKSLTTVEYVRGVKTAGWPPFNQRLWQRNYYEHIARDDKSLTQIRQYIYDNPVRWSFDPENSLAVRPAQEGTCPAVTD